jgi:hypothetical protein
MKRKANFSVLTESEAQKIQGGFGGFNWFWSFFCWWNSNCGGGNNNGGCGGNTPPPNPGGNP